MLKGSMIRRRHVFHIAGYDPVTATRQHRSFVRQAAIFAKTWNVTASIGDVQTPTNSSGARWATKAGSSNWQVESVYEPLQWDDIVLADMSRPMATRLSRSMVAFANFIGSGAVLRYFRANPKYGVFFLFPFFFLAVFAFIGFEAGSWTARYFEHAGIVSLAVGAVVGVAVFLGLLQWPGRRWRVLQGLDDWIFSLDYVHGRRSDVEARLDGFAERIVACARDSSVDEIVLSGHSMGATLAIDVMARALARDPALGQHGPKVCVLTIGSTIPKFTLHPAGDSMRRSTAIIAEEPSVAWAEYHARDDAISFYKFDPVTSARLSDDSGAGKPMIRRVQIHEMLEPQTFSRYRFKYMRLHYQFVMANDRRSIYDYFMMVCGPIPFTHAVRTPLGPIELIGPDGAFLDTAPIGPIVAA
jgi:hypothetical protein